MLTHVVMFRLTDPGDSAEVIARARDLRGQIAAMRSIRCGPHTRVHTQNSYDVALITEHDDEAGLREYQQDPAHKAYLAWLAPRLAARVVVDSDDLR